MFDIYTSTIGVARSCLQSMQNLNQFSNLWKKASLSRWLLVVLPCVISFHKINIIKKYNIYDLWGFLKKKPLNLKYLSQFSTQKPWFVYLMTLTIKKRDYLSSLITYHYVKNRKQPPQLLNNYHLCEVLSKRLIANCYLFPYIMIQVISHRKYYHKPLS